MPTAKLLSKKRYYGDKDIREDNDTSFYRTSFHRDYDRLIFSNSFRRLSKKTQVHPLSKNDHVHNRLTHSLEVASVGRSLGLRAGEFLKNERGFELEPYDAAYIVQTACLAHDIGNPPFGHAGEEVVKEWFSRRGGDEFLSPLSPSQIEDFIHFDGNAQSFRVVTKLENNTLDNGGMRLTFATLGSLVKYPHSSLYCKGLGRSKYGYFGSEEDFFGLLFEELGLVNGDGSFRRHPLSYLMEAADDVCYGLLDLQDATELGIVDLTELKEIFTMLCGKEESDKTYENRSYTKIQKVSKLAAMSINNLSNHAIEVFCKNFDSIMDKSQPKELTELFLKEELISGLKAAKSLAKHKIFNDKRKIELELGAYNIIETLLNNLIPAVYELYEKDGDNLSFRSKRALELMAENRPQKSENLYLMHQRVVDYIAGMTDNYAKHIANQLNGFGR